MVIDAACRGNNKDTDNNNDNDNDDNMVSILHSVSAMR